MEKILIEPKDKSKLDLVKSMLEAMHISFQVVSEEEEKYLKSEECFQNFLKETDSYIEKLRLQTDTSDDCRSVFHLRIGDEAIDYQRILSRASQHSPMEEKVGLEHVLKYRDLLHKHKDFKLASNEMYQK